MTTLIIISLYIVSVFLARYFNMKTYQIDDCYPVTTLLWFIPFLGLASWLFLFLMESSENQSNWFSGKDW
jgi:hypothetical protein